MGTPGSPAAKRSWSGRRWLLFGTGFACILLLGIGGGLCAVAAYEFVLGGAARVEKFATGELRREQLAKGDSRAPEGFVLTLGFVLGGSVGLLLWRRVAQRSGVSKTEMDDALR